MFQTLSLVLVFFLVNTSVLSNDTHNRHNHPMHEDEYCKAGHDGTSDCSQEYRSELVAIEPVAIGHRQDVEVAGKVLQMKTLALKPSIFTIDNFLTVEETSHLVELAERAGLIESGTSTFGSNEPGVKIMMDVNSDMLLSVNEMVLTVEDSFDLYLSEDDVLKMYDELGMDSNKDTFLTPEEVEQFDMKKFTRYISFIMEKNPNKLSRQSQQVWVLPDTSDDAVFQQIQMKVQQLTKLSTQLIQNSDFQVVKYEKHGHYNAHYDSGDGNDVVRCCHRNQVPLPCRLCRFMTVLFYLNDVEEGGETAFPIADNVTFDAQEFRLKHSMNLQRFCDKAILRVAPQRGKAVLWYNHKVDTETGWLGAMDEYSIHGGCPIVNGEKWIANFWINAIDSLKPDPQ